MSTIEAICQAYARMRDGGIAIKAALNLLRDSIDSLGENDKLAVARQLRDYEAQRSGEAGTPSSAPTPAAASLADVAPRRLRSLAAKQPAALLSKLEWVNCPRCGKSNQRHEVLCYACGHLLQATQSASETQALAETNDLSHSNDFFDKDTVLVLRARATGQVYEVRPQHSDHELVIGRSTAGSAVLPDIDLADQEGGSLGVSRLHLALRYDARYHTVSAFDMGSANGTYINGQRLHAHEVRVLRDGDELRLGRLVLTVSFRRPT